MQITCITRNNIQITSSFFEITCILVSSKMLKKTAQRGLTVTVNLPPSPPSTCFLRATLFSFMPHCLAEFEKFTFLTSLFEYHMENTFFKYEICNKINIRSNVYFYLQAENSHVIPQCQVLT